MKHLLIASAAVLTLSGCVAYTEPVVYRHVPTYVAPAPVWVSPPIVVVRPTPCYSCPTTGRPYRR